MMMMMMFSLIIFIDNEFKILFEVLVEYWVKNWVGCWVDVGNNYYKNLKGEVFVKCLWGYCVGDEKDLMRKII